jgi:aminoglycoside phosphotransferase (APT) family kinase protein
MEAELRAWLRHAGLPGELALTPLQRGLGSTELWACAPAPHAAALVVRLFPAGAEDRAAREALAMEAAARHGLPVPAIVLRGTVAHRPVLVSTLVAGELGSQVLLDQPARAAALGVALGQTLGRLHEVIAPAPLHRHADAWLDLGGPALAPLRPWLAAVPHQERLIHLDYHLKNVLMQAGRVTGVIDWENARAGPPHMDLARSRAILRVVRLAGRLSPARHAALARFEQGLVAGHAQVIGADPHPGLSAAWGLAMTTTDLAGHLGKPGAFVTPALLARLAAERDVAIRSLEGGEAPPPAA